jgi:hypothetical protein
MENKIHLTDLHTERKNWLNILSFTIDEMDSMKNRLAEIVAANNKTETTAKAEHFQNQFILQRDVLDVLRHDINETENEMVKQIEANPVATDHKTAPDHTALRERMDTFERLFNELKQEFNTFAAKTL